jgi:hypothetical protein
VDASFGNENKTPSILKSIMHIINFGILQKHYTFIFTSHKDTKTPSNTSKMNGIP